MGFWSSLKEFLPTFAGRSKYVASLVNPFQQSREQWPLTRPNQWQLLHRYRDDIYTCATMISQIIGEEAVPRLYTVTNPKRESLPMSTRRVTSAGELKRVEKKMQSFTDNRVLVEVLEHPVLDLLHNVNNFMAMGELFEFWSLYLDLAGHCYVYVARDQAGIPRELWIMPPERMRAVLDRQKFISHWIFGYGETARRFEVDEILFTKRPSPVDQVYGFPPLLGALSAADASSAILEYENQLLRNRAVPDMIMSVKGQLDDPRVDRIRSKWREQFQRGRMGDIAVMSGDDAQIQQLAWKPRDLEYTESAAALTKLICRAFGVPISLLEDESANRSLKEASLFQLAKFAIAPRVRRMEDVLNQNLLPMFPGIDEKTVLLFDDVVPADKQFQLEERKVNLDYMVTVINEERRVMGKDPVEWGDRPVKLQEWDRQDEREERAADRQQEMQEAMSKLSPQPAAAPQGQGPAPGPKKKAVDPLLGRESIVWPDLEETVASNFKEQRAEIQSNLDAVPASEDLTVDLVMFDRAIWDKKLSLESRSSLGEAMAIGATEGAIRVQESGAAFDQVNVAVANDGMQKAAKEMSDHFAVSVNDTTEERVTGVIEQAQRKGWDRSRVASELDSIFL